MKQGWIILLGLLVCLGCAGPGNAGPTVELERRAELTREQDWLARDAWRLQDLNVRQRGTRPTNQLTQSSIREPPVDLAEQKLLPERGRRCASIMGGTRDTHHEEALPNWQVAQDVRKFVARQVFPATHCQRLPRFARSAAARGSTL